MTDAWINFLTAAEGNLSDANTLAFAGQEAILEGYTKTYGLRGGNDQLPRAFAAALGTRITYRATVRRIDSRPDEVVVGYQDSNGAEQQITADFGVCTIPFPVLKKVDLVGLANRKGKLSSGTSSHQRHEFIFKPETCSGEAMRWARWVDSR